MRFLILISTFSSMCFAGEITMMPAKLQGREVSVDRSVIEYCVYDDCRSLGSNTGYTRAQWKEVGAICNEYSYVGGSALNMVTDAALLIGWSNRIPTADKILVVAISMMFEGKISEEDAAMAADMMMGTLGNSNFPLDPDKTISLRNGIEACAKEYEWRNSKPYKRRINGWARPLG